MRRQVKVFNGGAATKTQNQIDDTVQSMEDLALAATKKTTAAARRQQTVPNDILNDPALNAAIASLLPSNYDFEMHKTIHFVRTHQCRKVALQMPEGLLLHATAIAGIVETFAYPGEHSAHADDEPSVEVVILAEVTYGACCIDDYTARALDCDLLVHYGHSCLIPITTTQIRTLYVFVNIGFDMRHLCDTVTLNFPDRSIRLAMVATIQFASSLQLLKQQLLDLGYINVTVPQAKPLSPGEILGCTSPRLSQGEQAVLYLGDGRFHLESMMIANPHLAHAFYRYDPYSAKITREYYQHQSMRQLRRQAIEAVRSPSTKRLGLVMGTLGRQGSLEVIRCIEEKANARGKELVVVLMSELSSPKLRHFVDSIDAWIQTSCPRLSIDWGYAYDRPLLTPYEATLALLSDQDWDRQRPKWIDSTTPSTSCNSNSCSDSATCCSNKNAPETCTNDESDAYPMDFYAFDSLGPWTPNHRSPSMAAAKSNRVPGTSWRDKIKKAT